jgi:hypothetical protein
MACERLINYGQNCDFVSYVTDVEGNFNYFRNVINQSPSVSLSPCETKLELTDRHGLVFGGDLFDKGKHDIRLANLICDLKEKYPDRVWLLMGNRDINKMRLSSEMDEGELSKLHDGMMTKKGVCWL